MLEYSFVIPVYNESETIKEFYAELLNTIAGLENNFEIIFSTGGNTDNTLELLKDISDKDRRVKIINLSQRFDYQTALTAGLDYSTGRAVITLDGDLQHPPKLIPDLIKEWEKGYDIVYTVRDYPTRESFFRKATSRLFYLILKLITNIDFEKNCADFRLLSRKAVSAFKQFPERKRYIPGIISILGFKKTGIKYLSASRKKGRTKFTFSRMLSLAINGIFSFSIAPIRLITVFGLIATFFSFIYLVSIIAWSILHRGSSMGWASILSSILLLSSLQIFTLGVIGEYVGRIYEETKRRPLYIIDELIGF